MSRNPKPRSERQALPPQPESPEDALQALGDPELDPFEIEFLPEFEQGRGPRAAFVNEHGVLIGDHQYESPESPLERWSADTDPAVMAGDEWVHPYKDVGFRSDENRRYFEEGVLPSKLPGSTFQHADKNTAFEPGPAEEDEL